jgi:hypothetical protein
MGNGPGKAKANAVAAGAGQASVASGRTVVPRTTVPFFAAHPEITRLSS